MGRMQLIGFTGLKGSGKDTAASVLVEAGYEHVKFAGGLKAMLRALLDYQGATPETIDEMIDGEFKEVSSRLLNMCSPRWAMQSLGTSRGRTDMGDDFWVNITKRRVQQFERVVISDVRFPNEVRMIHDLGGKVYRIERGAAPPDMHPSEALIPTLDVDGGFNNCASSAAEFREWVADMLAFVGTAKAA